MTEIKCCHCKTLKDTSCFFKDKYNKRGFNSKCKDCCKIIHDIYYNINKDKIHKYCKEKVTCEFCNKVYAISNKSHHNKTKFHLASIPKADNPS